MLDLEKVLKQLIVIPSHKLSTFLCVRLSVCMLTRRAKKSYLLRAAVM